MNARRKSGRGSRSGDYGAHWISYSDMMASLLLVFVLAVVYSVYQLATKTEENNRIQANLVLRERELITTQAELKGKEKELDVIQIQLEESQNELNAAKAAQEKQEAALTLLQTELINQATELATMKTVLDTQRDQLLNYQQKIDAMLGVRTQIIQELNLALKAANLDADVDEKTGDITLKSKVFFDSNAYTIKDDGKDLLDRFLPVYLGVLMRPEYEEYVGEIIIEGHTDSNGPYLNNLRLSQNRALAVAEYCLQASTLTPAQQAQLQNLLTAKGRSETDLIFYPGTQIEDQESSRRVEFKFRLKDAEMIDKMNEILNDMDDLETGGSI